MGSVQLDCQTVNCVLPFAQVLREGKGQDTRPDKGQRVTIQVSGRTEDGTGVDWNSSLEFILGEGEVIQGKLCITMFLLYVGFVFT